MLFDKLFGRRKPKPPRDTSRAQVTASAQAPGTRPQDARQPPIPTTPGKEQKEGFDPYNSGAFKKGAWERVNKR